MSESLRDYVNDTDPALAVEVSVYELDRKVFANRCAVSVPSFQRPATNENAAIETRLQGLNAAAEGWRVRLPLLNRRPD